MRYNISTINDKLKIYIFLFAAEEDVPSESQCRPYIEKALKELETGDAEHGTIFW